MGLRDETRAIDQEMHDAFLDVGIGELASYRAPGAAEFVDDVRAIVRLGTQVLGEFSQIVGYRDEVDILLGTITPQAKGTLVVDDLTLTLTDKLGEDAGVSKWVVRRG